MVVRLNFLFCPCTQSCSCPMPPVLFLLPESRFVAPHFSRFCAIRLVVQFVLLLFMYTVLVRRRFARICCAPDKVRPFHVFFAVEHKTMANTVFIGMAPHF